MTQKTVRLQISFESLANAIACLPREEKRILWQMLDEEINPSDKADLLEQDPYEWGSQGQPKGKPVEYIPGVGIAVIGGKDEIA